MTWSHNFEACGYQLSTLNTINSPLLLRARVVLPVSQPPIHEGAGLISGNRVVAVGRAGGAAPHHPPPPPPPPRLSPGFPPADPRRRGSDFGQPCRRSRAVAGFVRAPPLPD